MSAGTGEGETPKPRDARVRTPSILQMEATECGAACLAIVLGHHGRPVPLEELRTACDVGRNGTKASNVIRAARGYGLEGSGYSMSPETIRSMDPPLIAHWNFNHFVVVEGFKKDTFFLNDPAIGRYRVTSREFDESFTGVVLAVKPGPEFRRGQGKPGIWRALGERMRGSMASLMFVVLAALGLVVPGLAVPAFVTVFVDEYLIRRDAAILAPLLACMAAMMILGGGLVWVQQMALLHLRTRLSFAGASAFLWHVLRLPIEFFTQRSAGEVGTRVAINFRVAQLVSGRFASTALDLFTAVFFLAIMVLYDLGLTLVVVAIAAANVIGLRLVSQERTDASRRVLVSEGALAGATMGGLRTIDLLKATSTEPEFYSQWSGRLVKQVNAQQDLGVPTSLFSAVPPLLQALCIATLLSIGALRVMHGELTPGMLLAFQFLAIGFLVPVNRLVDLGTLLQQTEGDLDRLDDVLRFAEAPNLGADSAGATDDSTGTTQVARLSGAIEVREISFGYGRLDPPLIAAFSLTVAPGRRVALVGGSGSGKSTIARLVCGLYEPWQGTVLLDGKPRAELARGLVTRSLAMVSQDLNPFHGTVRENLSLWDRTLAHGQIERAARDACVHEVIMARGGYDSEILEGGRNFSGGQLQRMEIARALAIEPSILVLDEATSALDPPTEKQIVDNIRARGCTCLIVAHRLSTVRDCDEIILLERGRIVERGRHDELMNVRGAYAKLLEAE